MSTRTSSVRRGSHLHLEIVAAAHRGRPLDEGAPVPGCGCQRCSGVDPDEVLARQVAPEARHAWETRVDAARSVGVLEVAHRLGCGDPVKRGKEHAVRCPLHDDSKPSCTMDLESNLWYCFPCGEGGDAIDLYMRARRLSFAQAVRELT